MSQSTFERSKLSVILSDLDTIYMVLVHRSRTGSKRHYRLFAVVRDEIEDVTALVCEHTYQSINPDRQTFDLENGNQEKDRARLHHSLPQGSPPIEML